MRLLTASLLVFFLAIPAAAQQGCAAPASGIQTSLLAAINAERAAKKRKPLFLSAALTRAAQGHACDMARRGYFDHRSPEGNRMTDRIEATGYVACRSSENIAKGQRSATAVVAAWMDSRGHRRSILSNPVREVGFGMTGSGSSRLWVMVAARAC